MSINSFDQAFSIKVMPSLTKLILIVFIHLLVCFILFGVMLFTKFNILIFICGIVIILLSLIYNIKLHIKLNLEKSIKIISRNVNKEWGIILRNKTSKKVCLSPASFISNYLIILNFRDLSNERNYTVVITPRCIERDDYRRLKVLIKTGKNNDPILVTK